MGKYSKSANFSSNDSFQQACTHKYLIVHVYQLSGMFVGSAFNDSDVRSLYVALTINFQVLTSNF